jgi:flagellar protein FliS
MNFYLNQYQQNHVQTASKEQILIMLYDGAVRFIRQAREGIESEDLKAKLEGIGRAVNILTELSNTLDFEVGGEIAENLDALYSYMSRELIMANARNDLAPLQIVEDMLLDLKDGWLQAIEKNRAEQSSNAQVGHNQIKAGALQASV